jgi:hypothetical protein
MFGRHVTHRLMDSTVLSSGVGSHQRRILGRLRMARMTLVWPAREYLSSYAAALQRGWSSDNLRPARAQEELESIAADADAFPASLVDKAGPPCLSLFSRLVAHRPR